MASAWHSVRVFLSSTFRDMHAERDHLVKVTFPALPEKLLPHRVELYDIDLRWGITEDESKNEKVISLCLEQIDECRPFFLGFLGHRYGWAPAQVPAPVQLRFPFVKKHPGVSVTELEIRHALQGVAGGTNALLLFRDQQAVDSIPAATRTRDFVETDPTVQQKLARLKQALVNTRDKLPTMSPRPRGALAVQRYAAVWDPKRYDRVTRTEGKLHGLDDFGRAVEDWLWNAIRQQLQLPDTPAEVDPLDAEADLHERFLESRTRTYVGRDELYRRLRDFALADGESPLLLTRESGLGKSAALARFARDFRAERPDVFVLAHFVGASPRTTSLPAMLQRLTRELQRRFRLTLPKAESPDGIIRTFLVAITSVPAERRVVLVFDALNQLDADSRAETLVWLPEKLAPNVRVLCSSATDPRKAPRVLTAFGERVFVGVTLKPLSDDERRVIVKAVPKLVAKTLDDRQIDALLANPATHNPLFLMAALEEMRGYGSFERLNQMIAGFPRDGDVVTQLFEQVFERLEQEFNKPLVEWMLRLLACSRRGLSGPELVELTDNLGEKADDLYPVLRQLRPYLQVRDGLFDFYHMSVRRAVESRYLRWHTEEDRHDPWARWNPERHPPARDPTEPERETRHRLIDFFEANRLASRSVDELPWQLAQLRSWQRLFDLLGDLTFFSAAWRADELEVRTAWSLVKAVGGLEPIDAYRAVLANPTNHDGNALWSLAHYLQQSGHATAMFPLLSIFLDYFRRKGNEPLIASCLGNQALILQTTGDLEGAMRLHKEAEAICRRLNDQTGLSTSLGNQALILKDTDDLDGAMRLFKEQEAICHRFNDPRGMQACLGNQALILEATGDLDGAMRLRKEEEAIARRLNDAPGLSRNLGNQGIILKNTGNLDGAMRRHEEAEAICRRLNDPAGLSSSLGNQAMILWNAGNLGGAMHLFKEKEAICRRINDPTGLQWCLGNQAVIMMASGDRDGAMPLLKEQEEICRQLDDPAELQGCLGNQAGILMASGDLDGAMRLHKEEEAICRGLNDLNGVAISLVNQASLLAFYQSRPAEGLPLVEEALGIATKYGFIEFAQQIEPIVNQIRDLLK